MRRKRQPEPWEEPEPVPPPADKLGIPTEKEVAGLPRWARVAFAARCARRVQPIYNAAWSDAAEEQVAAIEQAILLAETTAAMGRLNPEARYVADAASMAAKHAEALWTSTGIHARLSTAAESVAKAAARAAEAAIKNAEAFTIASLYGREVKTTSITKTGNKIAAAAKSADDAAVDAITLSADAAEIGDFKDKIALAIRADFDKLKESAKREHWIDRTPVPLDFFGALWLEGEEPNWSSIRKAYDRPSKWEEVELLKLLIDPGDATKEEISELFVELSTIYRMVGGSGLDFTITDAREFVRELV